MHFTDHLFQAIEKKGTPLCVGFDPHPDRIPDDLIRQAGKRSGSGSRGQVLAMAVQEFLLRILERIHPHIAVIKPQFAFFEQLGIEGMNVLGRICSEARSAEIIVIGDAKRGDIGSTAAAYARAYLAPDDRLEQDPSQRIQVDALTVNPYLGWDGISPFLEVNPDAGVFVLVKTSNPSGSQVQDLKTESGTVAEQIAGMVADWGKIRIGACGYSDVGAVVGATYPEQARHLRNIMPQTPFLIPGYGFQGGSAVDALAGFDSRGRGGIINSSRGILFAYQKTRYQSRCGETRFEQAAETACMETIRDIATALKSVTG
ncbi:orotidine-5'-phosphate decarboxylase [bacterium]|nr:orotidine-5'-phosphate decarboxylase [candidate division CSSED10-310 bacterium]